MLTLPPSVKIYVAAQPVDARKSFDGLAALVEAEFGLEPMSGHLFVFLTRARGADDFLGQERFLYREETSRGGHLQAERRER